MSHVSTLGFHRPLIAAVHKGQAPALVADCIALAAAQFAMNAGAANNIEAVRLACLTTEKHKARTPAAGTLAALVLSAMDSIKAHAEAAGARKAKDDKRAPDERQRIADAFGAGQRAAFVAAVDAAAAARKEAADKRAADKGAATPAAAASTGEGTSTTKEAATVNPAELDPLVALQALGSLSDAELTVLAAKHADIARRVAACLTLPLAASGAAAAAVVTKARRAAKTDKVSPAAPGAAAATIQQRQREQDARDEALGVQSIGAMAAALVGAGIAPANAVHAAA